MTSGQASLEPAFVLHQRAYGENGAVLEVFSREHGRIGLVARGVRSGRSRRQALLQPFSPVLISWRGRGELSTLADVEPAGRAIRLAGTALISGFYLNELLLRMLRRDDPHPDVFDDYLLALQGLEAAADEAPVLRVFEKRLLDHLGYGLTLAHDAHGQPVQPDGRYLFDPHLGAELALEGSPGTVSGAALLALAREDAAIGRFPAETRRVLHQALAPHLGERPLRSRELYRQFIRKSDGDDKGEHHAAQ